MLELRLQTLILKKIALFIHNMNHGYHISYSPAFEFVDMLKRATLYFDCTPTEIYLQAVDPNKTSLVDLRLRPDAFKHYRCDRPISLGIASQTMADILDFAANDDNVVTVKADDDGGGGGDYVTFMFESDASCYYAMRLREVEKDSYLSIPEPQIYQATVQMPLSRFVRITKCLIGNDGHDATVMISVTNEGVKFCRINLSREFPVVVEYEIAKTSFFRFFLVPLLENEDEPTEGVPAE